ncbi:MAG: T9SS type A sorting domain-containing protein [Saprospiraceae bacterium]|nr:T9SS type A sorting domain-containing protein [Saprospiraceae bacterium]
MKNKIYTLLSGIAMFFFALNVQAQQTCTLTNAGNVTTSNTPGQCSAQVTVPSPTVGAGCSSTATVVVASQNFNASTLIPAGWTTSFTGSPAPASQFGPSFALPANANFNGNVARINSNAAFTGAGSGTITSALIGQAPVAGSTYRLRGDYAIRRDFFGPTDQFLVQVSSDGITWVTVFDAPGAPNNAAGSFDVAVTAQMSTNFRARFTYVYSGWNWWAEFDNIQVVRLDPIPAQIVNSFNNTNNASGVYPVGTTTITWTVVGTNVTTTQTVTVNDTEAPQITCPAAVTFTLPEGACTVPYFFNIPVTDNCPPGTVTLNGPAGAPVAGQGSALACSAGPNSIITRVNVGSLLPGSLLSGITYVHDQAGATGTGTGTINVFCAPFNTTNIPYAAGGFTPFAIASFTYGPQFNGQIRTINFANPVAIPANCGAIWIEIIVPTARVVHTPAGTGTNTWIVAPACGLNVPGTFISVGFALDAAMSIVTVQPPIAAVPFTPSPNPTNINQYKSGDNLPVGTHCFRYRATDNAGNNSAVCNWCVTVNPISPITANMVCNNHVNVSLDANCQVRLNPDMLLEGSNYGCFDNYQIRVWPFGNQAQATGNVNNVSVAFPCGTHTYEVINQAGNRCWGTFTIEDKTAPTLTCECANGFILVPITSLTSNLTAASPRFARPSVVSVPFGACAPAGVNTYPYQAFTINIPSAGSRTFTSVSLPGSGTTDNFLALYINSFNPAAPCQNLVLSNDDTNGLLAAITYNFPGPGTYVLVNTTFSSAPALPSNWAINITGGAVNSSTPCTVACYDVDAFMAQTLTNFTASSPAALPQAIQNRISWTPECCGPVTVTISNHKFINDMCEGGTLVRKWLVRDASGNTAQCEQTFFVTNIGFNQVFIPNTPVDLTCKDATDPESIVAKTGDVRNGYPYIVRGNTFVPVNGSICKIFCTYNDTEITACGAHCHGNKKVIRTWTCLDWCTGQTATVTQVIKATDDEAPTAILKDTVVSTRPWDCTADFFVPNPWELHDDCDINPQWTVKGPVGVQIVPAVQVVNGQTQPHPVYKWRAVGAPKGVHTFKYTFVDCCGNERVLTNQVTVEDKTPPTPIAKRDIVIGLVPGYDANGFPDGQAKLFARDVDNGSHDNCSAVRLDIRRPKGPSCGNDGLITNPATGARHNNNLTFSNRVNMPNYSPNDTDGAEFVKFCCADLDALDVDANGDGVINDLDRGFVEVILRVWDDGNMNGIIGDAGDNWNETWAFVKVEQKVPPVLTCPPDATIHCDWAIQTSTTERSIDGVDFTKTGLPTAVGVCANPPIRFRDVLQLNQCGIGTINRTFSITANGVTRQCQQRITVAPSTSTQQWVVTPPSSSVPEVGCDGPTEAQIKANQPTWVNGPCDVIGISTKKWEFEFEDGVCKKWVVEYKLVNWCTNEERGPYTKMFVYKDVVPPTFDKCRDTMFGVDQNCEIRFLTLTKRANDTGGCIENGWIKWVVIVDLWADGTPDYEWSSFLPVGNDVNNANTGNFNAIQDNNGNGIKDIYLAPTANGGEVTIRIPEPIVGKMSNHKVTWKATDGCHNYSTCHEDFMVADKKPPTPVCVPLSTALMADPDGSGPMRPMVELWAIDFNVKSFDNCTDERDLLYTFDNTAPQVTDKTVFNRLINIDIPHYFDKTGGLLRFPADMTNAQQRAIVEKYMRGEENTAGNGVIQLWNPAQRSSAKVWTDRELAPNTNKGNVDVMMSVWDKKFNVDFCWTNLQLICNTCPGGTIGSKVIAGTVATEAGQNVSQVSVSFGSNQPEYPRAVMTGSNGQYAMSHLELLSYEVSANKDNDYTNGVSTLDLVLIQRHILNQQKLNSPYKLIAADATNDGKVTAADITELRKLILGVTNDLPNNTSWRFPIAAQTMDAENPWPFAEVISIPALIEDMSNQNFVAVKVGDVNGSVSANVSDPALESRSAKVVRFTAEDRNVAAGERVAVAISGADFADVYGYQFTMNLNGASFAEIVPGAVDMTANNIGVLASDVVTMSYASRNGVTVSDDETLFTVVLKAEKAGRLSEMMSIGSAVTKAEAYTGADLQVSNVTLSMRTKEVTADVAELFQNEPNPFRGATTVSYYLPEASDAVITVFDVTGRVVLVRKASANKGMNSEVFTKEQLGAAGVLYYRLDSGDFTATKKMIVIE